MVPLILPPVVNSARLVNKTQVEYLPDMTYFHLSVTSFTRSFKERHFISPVEKGFCPG